MANQFDDIGFAPGAVMGARTFLIDGDGWLTGLYYKQRWSNGENDAVCRKHEKTAPPTYNVTLGYWTPPEAGPPLGPHSIADCKHGFYGYHDGSNDYRANGPVWGVIQGYGITVLGTRGFRAMKARILGLVMRETVAAAVAETVHGNYWNVPFFESFEELIEVFPPEAGVK